VLAGRLLHLVVLSSVCGTGTHAKGYAFELRLFKTNNNGEIAKMFKSFITINAHREIGFTSQNSKIS